MNKNLFDSINRTYEYNDLIGKKSGIGLYRQSYIESQKKAILEEIHEFYLSNFGTVEELDALCDIIVTCIGMMHICDFKYQCFLEGRAGLKCISDLSNYLISTSNSIIQLADLCCRTINGLFSTIGYQHFYDLHGALEEVCMSNLTKSVTSDKDIQNTIDKYKEIGVSIHFNEFQSIHMPICSKDVVGKDGKKYFKGKGLKGVNYKEPDLRKFVK